MVQEEQEEMRLVGIYGPYDSEEDALLNLVQNGWQHDESEPELWKQGPTGIMLAVVIPLKPLYTIQ